MLKNGWESRGNIDHTSPRVERIPNGLPVQGVAVVDSHQATSTYSCRASHSKELDDCKPTRPTGSRFRRFDAAEEVVSHAIGLIHSIRGDEGDIFFKLPVI